MSFETNIYIIFVLFYSYSQINYKISMSCCQFIVKKGTTSIISCWSKVWPLSGLGAIKRIIHNCTNCFGIGARGAE